MTDRTDTSVRDTALPDGRAASVRGLTLEVDAPGVAATVVRDMSFDVGRGEIVGLVGESGSGKTLTGLAMADLLPRSVRFVGGTVEIAGRTVRDADGCVAPDARRDIAMVFQNPMTSLNPTVRVGDQIAEAVRLHRRGLSRSDSRRAAVDLLDKVGIPDAAHRARQLPFEFSGGMRQRVMIAIALACDPAVLVADEPTTALDVTVQRGVMDLIQTLCRDLDLGVLLVSHDLAVVSERCDRMLVLYAGGLVETGPVLDVLTTPAHPYVDRLLDCMPDRVASIDDLHALPGRVPQPGEIDRGCAFAPRCSVRVDRCTTEAPALVEIPGGRAARCHLVDDDRGVTTDDLVALGAPTDGAPS